MIKATRLLLKAGASALLIGFFVAPAHAVPVVDQEQADAQFGFGFSKTTQMRQVAQTFTAGVTGDLLGVSLRLGARSAGAEGGVVVQIRNTQSGNASIGTGWVTAQIPGSPEFPPGNGEILASAFISAADLSVVDPTVGQLPDFTSMIEFDVPVSLESGSQYAILLFSSADYDSNSEFVWAYDWGSQHIPAGYPEGSAFYRVDSGYGWTMPSFDYAFRTFVDGTVAVPEPSGIALLAVGLLGLATAASARRTRG